jgi:hypothetical protein
MLATRRLPFKIIAIDPVEARREKMNCICAKIDPSGRGLGQFVTKSIDEARDTVAEWTKGVGCTSVLEVRSIATLEYAMINSKLHLQHR